MARRALGPATLAVTQAVDALAPAPWLVASSGGADSLATAYTLSKAAEKIGGYDLLLTGRNSDDGDTAQVGAAIAAFLSD